MTWRGYEHNPVVTVGESGEWDAGALGTMSVLKVGDVFHMYYEAWGNRSGVAWVMEDYYSLQIGHAKSHPPWLSGESGLFVVKSFSNRPFREDVGGDELVSLGRGPKAIHTLFLSGCR